MLMLQHLVNSTLLGCLMLTSSGVAMHSTVASAPIIDSSFNSPDPKTIAEQVRQDAIAKEKLDQTAKARIERVGREIWMYNPVPYWKVTIADQHQTLVYLTTQEGRFRVLMSRNGQPTHPVGKPAQEIAPAEMRTTALNSAIAQWDYPAKHLPQILSEKVTWTSGCENVSAPFACDPVLHQGWKITMLRQNARWVFRGETAQDLQLIERTSGVEQRLPANVRDEIKRIAGNHFQLSPSVVLITNIDLQTFSDSCLGLGDLAETCVRQDLKGYRVTVTGQKNQQQIYRISNNTKFRRTEAIAGLPTRTDELPTAIARKVFSTAQKDLQRPIASLKITQVAPTFNCFRSPTDPPNTPCLPTKSMNGWKVTVTNNQKSLTYTLSLNGSILGKH